MTPRKALGQHFLVDELILSDIADACRLGSDDTVLEVGAGPGALTEELAKRAGHVVAVELDEQLASVTRGRLSGYPGVCVVAADILDFTPAELLAECGAEAPYVATGNLPYYITQPVVRRLLAADPAPQRIVVLVQREVARRMVGGPGQESLLSMTIKTRGVPEPLFDVPASAFWPAPKVQSAAVRIELLPSPAAGIADEQLERWYALLRAGFLEPRRQLHNVLAGALGIGEVAAGRLLNEAAVDPAQRAQHLAIEDWRRLYDLVDSSYPRALDAP